jgi:HAD superfamily phosphoserine phosphatase-like hydrolase
MLQLQSSQPRSRVRLVAFDVDGTLLRGPTICECIAAGIGKQEEMRTFERLTSAHDIASARAAMVAWYRCHDRTALLRHVHTVTLAPGAREGVAVLKEAGVQVALVSITWQFAVECVAARLGADFAVGTRWCDDDTIAHFWPEDKATWLAQCAIKLGLNPTEVAAVGDSASDLPMLRYAGIGYFVGRGMEPLPTNVKRCPAADIREIACDICENRPRSTNIDELQKQ